MTDLDLAFVDETVERIGRGPESAIPILQAVQEHYRYLPEAALRRISDLTEITPAQIVGIATFYSQFRHRPMGKHLIRVCIGTACHVKGAGVVHDAFLRHLGVPDGDDTDPDGLFTVEQVACLGCCTLAPVVQIGDLTYGHLTPEHVPRAIHDFLESEKRCADHRPGKGGPAEPEADGAMGEIRITLDTCCLARGSGQVYEALLKAVAETGARTVVKGVGCTGMTYLTPLVTVTEPGSRPALYANVAPQDAEAIVLRHFRPRGPLGRAGKAASRLLDQILTDEAWKPLARYAVDVRDPPIAEFLRPQKHIATEHSGHVQPTDLDEYLSRDGFKPLERCLTACTPEKVIEEIRASGLRGRGGAGYPTGLKWRRVQHAAGTVKYIVCNGDEGDPGAFMDRMILESYPYRVLEGMAIAATTIGAEEGVLYIRAEYPLAVRRVNEAIRLSTERGFLGEDLLGTGRRLHLRIMEGAGAFVCGEETALLESIMGRRGMPRLRPPYPAEHGLWGCPTLVNNVETYALVPWIIRNGAAAFAELGTEHSKGTKVFALAGKVARGGLIEVPMGATIRQVVEEIGGGVAGGRTFKAVQIGGPSGGCVPARLADTPIDYEALTGVGAMMGSGGLVVLDDADCIIDIARYFMAFTQDQSCGRCTPCRVGTRRMLDVLERLCQGQGKKGDIEELQALAHYIKRASLCGLGKTAPNPVLTTIEYFRDEYEAHIAGRCPAGRCKALITYSITDDCIGCTRCAQHCPSEAIAMRPYEQHEIDPAKCVRCDTCRQVCPVEAVKVM
ncbi:MAG TPA: NAD(P)H-dependent oxidoreductase subunit E [Phycisphaerae bacterium]|nr:NAD(P)H-dependent oxidoreductase subunit E [Phycisphaerae bacterium]